MTSVPIPSRQTSELRTPGEIAIAAMGDADLLMHLSMF